MPYFLSEDVKYRNSNSVVSRQFLQSNLQIVCNS